MENLKCRMVGSEGVCLVHLAHKTFSVSMACKYSYPNIFEALGQIYFESSAEQRSDSKTHFRTHDSLSMCMYISVASQKHYFFLKGKDCDPSPGWISLTSVPIPNNQQNRLQSWGTVPTIIIASENTFTEQTLPSDQSDLISWVVTKKSNHKESVTYC